MFIDDTALTTALRDTLQLDSAKTLTAYWSTIITASNLAAYWEIVSALMERGYTKAVIDTWDRGAEFQRSLGLYWCLEHGAAMDSESVKNVDVEKFDRRLELCGDAEKKIKPVAVTVAGVLKDPTTTYGQMVSGKFDTTDDLFVVDPDDSRRGVPTEF